MTCKDCLYFKACEDVGEYMSDEYINRTSVNNDVRDLCYLFTDKADFVEVVRCKDCRHNKPTIYEGKHACIRQCAYKKPDDFCSYGERKQDIGLDKENDDDSEGIEGIEDKTPGNDSDGTDGSSCC